MDEFGVEEALVAGTGLLGADFKLAEHLRVGQIFIEAGVGVGAQGEDQGEEESG